MTPATLHLLLHGYLHSSSPRPRLPPLLPNSPRNSNPCDCPFLGGLNSHLRHTHGANSNLLRTRAWSRRINELAAGESMPMVSAGERAPDYLCMEDVDEDIVTLEDESFPRKCALVHFPRLRSASPLPPVPSRACSCARWTKGADVRGCVLGLVRILTGGVAQGPTRVRARMRGWMLV
jgi:hypothetical protein